MMLFVSLILLLMLVFAGLIYIFRNIIIQNVASATKHLDEMSRDYESREAEVKRRLEEAKAKSEEMLAKSREEASALKVRILKDAEAERDKMLKDARIQNEKIIRQADKSRELLLSELEERIEKEAVGRACELIQENLPERFKRDAHAHWIKELIDEAFSQLKELPVADSVGEAKVISAFPLEKDERESISKRLKKLLMRDMAIQEEIDPKIVAGIIVKIGSLVLDGSLRNKIRSRAADGIRRKVESDEEAGIG